MRQGEVGSRRSRIALRFMQTTGACLRPPSRQMRDLRALAAGLAGDRRPRQKGAARLHHERTVERVPWARDIGRRRALVLVPDVIADEMAGDAELNGPV